MNKLSLIFTLVVLAFASPTHAAVTLQPADSAPLQFAAAEIEHAAKDAKQPVPDVALSVSSGTAQSYRIKREGAKMRVIGSDTAGAMYGGLDIAEAIRTATLDMLKDSDHKPHIEKRGIKFNIPLDLRTPSYTDSSDAAQANIPEVALDDVWRTKAKLDDNFGFSGRSFVRKEMLADHEVVKRITMDEKVEFWHWVMQQAADRGIQIYVFTWNVFTYGAEGKHDITNGMGITAGEGMPHDTDSKLKEKWRWDTSGIKEFACGALNDENSRMGVAPGAGKGSGPQALVKQPYTSATPKGGFLRISVGAELILEHFDSRGELQNSVVR